MMVPGVLCLSAVHSANKTGNGGQQSSSTDGRSLCFYLVRHAESDNNAKGAHDARVAEWEAKSPDGKNQKVHFTREKRSIQKT